MLRQRILRRPAAPGDQSASRTLVIETDPYKRAGALALIGVLTYAVALIAAMPARAALVLTQAPALWSDVAGSAWTGQVALRDRVRLAWDADALRSIGAAALAADVAVSGPETDVNGRARLRPGSVVLENLTGVAGWPLITAVAPNLAFACDVDVRVDVDRLAFGGDRQGVEGDLATGPGVCRPTITAVSSAPANLPPLVAQATRNEAASRLVLTPRDNRAERLAEATLTRTGRLSLTVLPAGSALLPGGFVGPTQLETQL